MEYFEKLIKKSILQFKKPKSFKEGEEFEEFVRECIFDREEYKLIHKTHSYEQNVIDFVESSREPDYKFQAHGSSKIFHVECKFRNITKILNQIDQTLKSFDYSPDKSLAKEKEQLLDKEIRKYSRLEIYKKEQFKLHLEINNKEKVLVCIGLYDETEDGIDVFIIPIEHMLTNIIDINNIDYYAVASFRPFIPEKIYDFFLREKKSFCIRCKEKIQDNVEQPLCLNCLPIWQKFSNFKYQEKYCHSCGKDSSVTVAKPTCIDCFKKEMKFNY